MARGIISSIFSSRSSPVRAMAAWKRGRHSARSSARAARPTGSRGRSAASIQSSAVQSRSGVRRTDLGQGQEGGQGVLVGLHARPEALDLLPDEALHALAAQELGQATQRALIALEPGAEARLLVVRK